MTQFKKGDVVEILEKYQDPGDEPLTWMVEDGTEKSRATIAAVDSPMSLKPRSFPSTPTREKPLPGPKSKNGARAVEMLIWLLEDDESVSRALQRTLKASGYEVEAFADVQALRNRLPCTPLDEIDVLLFDVRLAQDSGLALWQSIREQASCPPVVFLSGNAQIHEAVSALKDGAADFLLKPFEQQSLLESLRRVNLLVNATEAVSSSGSSKPVSIVIEVSTGSASTAQISLTDNGPGIPAAQRETLFDLFATTKARAGGVGLWLSKYILQAQGANIRLDLEHASGARFVVVFPSLHQST